MPGRRKAARTRDAGKVAAPGPCPNFLIVGAMKAGTSSLHFILDQHPEIFMTKSPDKEVHYFDNRPSENRSVDWYLGHFTGSETAVARGESTPAYSFVPGAIPAIAEFDPGMRLVYLVRDPVDRAISHVEHRRFIGERKAAKQGIHFEHGGMWHELSEDLRHQDEWIHMQLLAGTKGGRRGYHARGIYHEQIRRIYRHFPEEQVFITRLDDLRSDPVGTLDGITDFLGVSRHTFEDLSPANVNTYERPGADVYEYLAAYYLVHNAILTEDFGIRTDDWRRSSGTGAGLGPQDGRA
ncbi:sulfotransferase domain-containing protein [bacterium]|nr:sulfotransferase domain-containing protein [bacterium]